MERIRQAMAACIVMLLIAGCVDATITTTVDSEAEIEQLQLEMEMDDQTYQLMLEYADEEGYDKVSEWVVADMEEDMEEASVGSIEYGDRERNGQWNVWIALHDLDKDEMENVTIEETDDNTIRYVTTNLEESGEDEDIGQLTYRVEMPGEIMDTNADRVDEETNTAIWEVNEPGTAPSEAYVESEADEGLFSGFNLGLGELIVIGLVIVVVGIGIAKMTGYSVPGLD